MNSHSSPPTGWQAVIGHNWATDLLAGAIKHQRIGHAYLITGPAQIGKTTLAQTFAQALNCTGYQPMGNGLFNDPALLPPPIVPCGQCRACQLIADGRHPDVRIVAPEVSGRGKATLKIETIRELQRDLNLAAYEAKYKVAILTDFETATIGAANAFLKTLEEPPSNVILLLTANDADTLLATITSRCRTISLRPLPTDLVEQSLAIRWRVPAAQAQLLAHLADGRLGWAVQASQDPAILQARHEEIDALYTALDGKRARRFELADNLTRKPELLPDLLQTWLSWWRDALILVEQRRGNGRSPLTNVDQQEQLNRYAKGWEQKQTLAALKQTNLALWQLQRNANSKLVIENLLLTYPLPPTAR